MKRLAAAAAGATAAVATIAATITGLTPASAAPGATAAPAAGSLDWRKCENKDLRDAGARCARLRVPLDYDDPDGKYIELSLSRIKATAPAAKRQGPLLVNPGGPGGSGLTLPLYFKAAMPKAIRQTYDLIGFDPRGVESSSPLDCGYNVWKAPQPAYRPVTDRWAMPGPNEQEWLAKADKMAAACEAEYGEDIAHYGTSEVVSDMDAIRKALGVEKINYYGYSYGTKLGQLYATRYPSHVRRIVLDSNVMPGEGNYESMPDSSRAFEVIMQKFFTWTAKYDRIYHLGDTRAEVEERYYDDEADLREDPLPKFGPSEWNDNFTFTAGYAQWLWPELASVWSKWRMGDTKPFLDFADDGSTEAERRNSTSLFLAVECVDSTWPSDYDTWRQDAFDSAEVAPFRTWSDVESALPCRVWPVEGREPAEIGADGVRMLVVGQTLDAPTPFAGSLEVRRLFPDSSLIAVKGGTEHATSMGGIACVDDKVFRYLKDGTLPARDGGAAGPDVTCKPGPAPKPSAADIKAAKHTVFAEGGDGGDGGDGGSDGSDGRPGGNGTFSPYAAWQRAEGHLAR